jgi:hypothetical protein
MFIWRISFLITFCYNFIDMGGIIQKIVFKTGQETISDSQVKNLFDFKIKDIYGNLIDFDKFRNKKAIMIVNVACK